MPHSLRAPKTEAQFCSRLLCGRCVFAVIAASIVIALTVSFCYGPRFSLAGLRSHDYSAPLGSLTSANKWLHILRDNQRNDEHGQAALALLRLQDPAIIGPLSEIAERKSLNSQLLVVTLLGQLQNDAALPTLRRLFYSGDQHVAQAAIAAVTTIATPAAESLLLSLLRDPVHGRGALPIIAQVANSSAGRVLSLTLRGGPLAAPALHAISNHRLADCTETILALARDNTGDVAFRLLCLEALAVLDNHEARSGLQQLQHDIRIGWKARRLLDAMALPEPISEAPEEL